MRYPGQSSDPRAIWLKLHIALGLGLGMLFALLGFTGSLSVYREELDQLLNPRLVIDEPRGDYLPLDRIMASVRAIHPSRHESWTLELPRTRHGMITAWYEKPHETFGEWYAPLMVSVNPYTAEVVASRFWGSTYTTWIYVLHTQLRLGLFGARTVGLLGLGLMVSALGGIYLFWPGSLRNVTAADIRSLFSVHYEDGLRRFALDCHRLLGLLGSVALLVLAFSGFHLAYPKLLESWAGASGMGHGEEGPAIRSTAVPNDRPISLAEAVVIARGPFPHAEVRRVATPAGENGTYRVNLRRPGEVNIRHPNTLVWIDRWSGQIREVRNPNLFTSGQSFVTWIWPLHTGEAFGAGGRLVVFMAGLIPLLLYVSGFSAWLIRQGLLQERPVDFSPLHRFRNRVGKVAAETVALLVRYLPRAGRWAWKVLLLSANWIKSHRENG
ncbi:MAG: PepSY-associated TM helix domain-containing protein [Methylococcaceae bacterium]|nr:PepSY-associated TM helix domain-containing protein [Methylococcaceae bacterium]